MAARRMEKLVELCQEVGGGHPVGGDVTNPDDCSRLVHEAAERLGGLDLVAFIATPTSLRPVCAMSKPASS